jgi:hypothetical protein
VAARDRRCSTIYGCWVSAGTAGGCSAGGDILVFCVEQSLVAIIVLVRVLDTNMKYEGAVRTMFTYRNLHIAQYRLLARVYLAIIADASDDVE